MATNELKVRIVFDTGQTNKELDSAKEKIVTLKGSLGDLESELSKARGELKKTTPDTAEYVNALERVRQALERLAQSKIDLSTINKTAGSAVGSINDLEAQIKRLETELRNAENPIDEHASAIAHLGQLYEELNGKNIAFKGIKEEAGLVKGSVAELELELSRAREVLRSTVPDTDAYKAALERVKGAQMQVAMVQGDLMGISRESTRMSANMTMALQSMNFTIRDSPYFFRSFSLGILAVGNNLNPLIDSLINLNKEAKAAGKTLMQELGGALSGSAGIVFAFSMLVTVLQAVTFAMSEHTEKTKQAKKSTEDLTQSLKDYNVTLQETKRLDDELKKSKYADMLEKTEEALKGAQNALNNYMAKQAGSIPDTKTIAQYNEAIKLQQANLEKVKGIMASTTPEVDKYRSQIKRLADETKFGSKELVKTWLQATDGSEALLRVTIESMEKDKEKMTVNSRQWNEQKKAIEILKAAQKDFSDDGRKDAHKTAEEKLRVEREIQKLIISNIQDRYEKERELAKENYREKLADFQKELSENVISADQFKGAASQLEIQLKDALKNINKEQIELTYTIKSADYDLGKEQQERFDEIKQKFIDNGYTWDESLQAFALQVVMQIKRKSKGDILNEELGREFNVLDKDGLMIPMKITPDLKDFDKEFDKEIKGEVKGQMKGAMEISNMLGNSLYNAFKKGGEGVQGFIDSLKEAIFQMLIMDGLKSIFSGGAVGIFSWLGFTDGGLVPSMKAADGAIVGGNNFSGDHLLVGVNSGEMILNKEQQSRLFNLLSSNNFGKMQNQQEVRVTVEGRIKAKGKDFVADIAKAQKRVERLKI